MKLIAFLILCGLLSAQQPNSQSASLYVQGMDAGPPYSVTLPSGAGHISVGLVGPAYAPYTVYATWNAGWITPGIQTAYGICDLDPYSIVVLWSGSISEDAAADYFMSYGAAPFVVTIQALIGSTLSAAICVVH
jgi:hypothetical protein